MRDEINTSVRDFIRGGQLFLHNMRMMRQVIGKIVVGGILSYFLFFNGFWFYFNTSPYERYVVKEWLLVRFSIKIDPNHQQLMRQPNGETYSVYSKDILESESVKQVMKKVKTNVRLGFYWSVGIIPLFLLIFIGVVRRSGKKHGDTRLIKGAYFLPKEKLAKILKRKKMASDIKLSGLPLIKGKETGHILIHGGPGSGKTTATRELLDVIRKRGDRAIIYDKHGDYLSRYYRQGIDKILNPLDERCVPWNVWSEGHDPESFDNMAAALMPMPVSTNDPFWINAARTIFSVAAYRMSSSKHKRMATLLRFLLAADLKTLEKLLKGTEGESLVSERIAKTALSVKTVLSTYLKTLRYLKDSDNPFSIRKWMCDLDDKGWLFITSRGDKHETLKPLISSWLDIAISSLSSLPEDDGRRIWFILEELPSLQRLPYLTSGLAELRKFGGCFVLMMQNIAQLREIYGQDGAESLIDLCRTRFFFSSNSDKIAAWASKELGESEVLKPIESKSYGADTYRDGVSLSYQTNIRPAVSATQIKNLPDLVSYVRLPAIGEISESTQRDDEIWPVTKIRFKYVKRPKINSDFVSQEYKKSEEMKDVEELIERYERKVILKDDPVCEEKTVSYPDDKEIETDIDDEDYLR